MLDGLEIKVDHPQRPIVLYLHKQDAGRKLRDEDHRLLIRLLKSLIDIAEVHVVKLSDRKLTERVDVLCRANVLIAVHNERSYGQMWMSASQTSTLVELFDEGTFNRKPAGSKDNRLLLLEVWVIAADQ